MQVFGKELFRFFQYGLAGNRGYRFVKHPDILAEPALWIILDQISNDLIVLQRALEQRVVSGSNQDSTIKDTLLAADYRSWQIRQQLRAYLDCNTTVLTYLNKSPKVRMLPYAPVALIGIPPTSIGAALDVTAENPFLVIPHEFAHHLYWYGRIPSGGTFASRLLLRQELRDYLHQHHANQGWIANWIEEIFADVVSCYLAKSQAVEALQKMLLSIRTTDFFLDNGTHPIPTLRPYIAIEALKLIDATVETDALELFWVEKLGERGMMPAAPPSTLQEARSLLRIAPLGQQSMSVDTALTLLRPLIAKLVPMLDRIQPDIDGGTEDAALDATWQNWPKETITLARHLALTTPKTFTEEYGDAIQDPISKTKEYVNAIQALISQDELPDDEKIPFNLEIDDAITLLDFGGWTDEGPGPPNFG